MDRAKGDAAGQSDCIGIGGAGDAKIGHFGDAVAGDQDVLRLDVAMDNAAVMGMFQRQADLDRQRHGNRVVEGTVFGDQFLQGHAFDVFLDDVAQVAVLAIAKDLDDVGVVEAGGSLGFGVETLDEFLVIGQVVLHDLDGDILLSNLVSRQIDIGHAALADRPDYGKAVADPVTGRKMAIHPVHDWTSWAVWAGTKAHRIVILSSPPAARAAWTRDWTTSEGVSPA